MLSPMNDMDFLGAVFDIPNRPAEKPLAMAFIQKHAGSLFSQHFGVF